MPAAEHSRGHGAFKLGEHGARHRDEALTANIELHFVAGLSVVIRSDGGLVLKPHPKKGDSRNSIRAQRCVYESP
jgi:hypothetical protein